MLWASKTQVNNCIFLYQQSFVLMLRKKRLLRASLYHTVNKHKMRKYKGGSVRSWTWWEHFWMMFLKMAISGKKMKFSRGTFLKFYLSLVLRTFVEFKWCISCTQGKISPFLDIPEMQFPAAGLCHSVTFSSPRPQKERSTVCDRVSHAKQKSYPMHQLWWQIKNTPEQNPYSYN